MTDPQDTPHEPRTGPHSGGRAFAPSQAPHKSAAPQDAAESDWWDGIMRAAIRWRLDEPPDRRVARALAALLSLTTESREALIDHLVRTWGRDVLLRRISLGWKEGGDDER
jgi:hypothetical protein